MFSGKLKAVLVEDDELGPGQVSIRKLSRRTLRRAATNKSIDQAGNLKALGGDVVKALNSKELEEIQKRLKAAKKTAEELRKERYASFDEDVILDAGIESWTYPVKVDAASIEKLDDESAKKLFEEIVDFSCGPIDEAEAEELPKGA